MHQPLSPVCSNSHSLFSHFLSLSFNPIGSTPPHLWFPCIWNSLCYWCTILLFLIIVFFVILFIPCLCYSVQNILGKRKGNKEYIIQAYKFIHNTVGRHVHKYTKLHTCTDVARQSESYGDGGGAWGKKKKGAKWRILLHFRDHRNTAPCFI